MTTYTNQYPADLGAYSKLSYSDQLNVIRNLLTKAYPDLTGEDQTIVADLMIRHDEDIADIDGQFYPLSEVPHA